MIEVHINLLAVLIAGLAQIAIGMLWHAPFLFGKHWMRSAGVKSMKGSAGSMIVGGIAALVMAYVLAFGIAFANPENIFQAMIIGGLVFIGFIAPILLGKVIWEQRPTSLFLNNAGYFLITLLAMSAIIYAL
jgi:hypothetical protein